MERLRLSQRIVKISEPILVEDSTFSTLAVSLDAVLEQLAKDSTHHDYLVALLLVLLAESGFYISSNSIFIERNTNTRLVYIPTNWKSLETGMYELCFTLYNLKSIKAKLIVIPSRDKLILNMFPCISNNKKIYNMVIQTLKYVNPYSSSLCGRYMNLKQLSHRFKDRLATPLRTDILSALRFNSPSLQGLPIELKMKIMNMLNAQAKLQLSSCSNEFNELLEAKKGKTLLGSGP